MFRAAARRDAEPSVPAPGGRHHRSYLERERTEARNASARVARAQRRASQVGAPTPVDGAPALRTPTDGTPAQPAASSGKLVIDNAIARRDPLTRPLPCAPGLPGARRAPDARRTVAGAGAL